MTFLIPISTHKKASEEQSFEDLSEDGLALLFAEINQNLRWVQSERKWYIWTENVWAPDTDLSSLDRIRRMVRGIANASDEQTAHLKKAATIYSIEKLSKTDRRLVAKPYQWDLDPWLLNTTGGTVNLKTGEIKEHNPKLYMTKIIKSTPSPHCPMWKQFLLELTDGDNELIDYLQRVFGYCLTGSVREHTFFFFFGPGRNGKGTLLNTIRSLMNDYAGTIGSEVLMKSNFDHHPTALASLHGKRLVISQEVKSGNAWDEQKIKSLTGGDAISARFMRQDFFEFKPQFKLLLSGNHKPAIQDLDPAMKARIQIIPILTFIPPERRDLDLSEKLESEHDGILNWAIEGAQKYLEQGLSPPASVRNFTDQYFEEENHIQQWVDACCETEKNFKDSSTALFESWKIFADKNRYDVGNQKSFKHKMENEGFRWKRQNTGRVFEGLRLKLSTK